MQLQAIGRDAAVSFATTGRAQIRAMPPFVGGATLVCVGIPLASDGYEGLFVQQIIDSRSAPRLKPGISWWSFPVTPIFRSGRDVVAWWATYRSGSVPDVDGRPQSWAAFIARSLVQEEAEALRSNGRRWLAEGLLRAIRTREGELESSSRA